MVAPLIRRCGLPRAPATAIAAGACFAAGIATVLSFNAWADWHPLAGLRGFERATVFDLLDYLTSNLLLPLGGFAIAVFAGWAVPAGRARRTSCGLAPAVGRGLRFLLRYVAPVGIAATTLLPFVL